MMWATPITAPMTRSRLRIVRAIRGVRKASRSMALPTYSSIQPGRHRAGRFSTVLAPAGMRAVGGCLVVMPRIQSPSGKATMLMRLAPTGPCPGGRRGGR
ncbi:hypothetical protein GCM10010266_64770 [Streptomyces griseomycini]|nr:hypothetical protein GCM10010266_64770 [Streptomyces griseomycini]